MILVFFFFKQKTAYEMRISDWSSDVCSSDLRGIGKLQRHMTFPARFQRSDVNDDAAAGISAFAQTNDQHVTGNPKILHCARQRETVRSEEHTSELQSLMRISYAVFCLKKKKNTKESKHSKIQQTKILI